MANAIETLFDLPTTPEEFSVLLPPSELRKIDFSALEYATSRRAIIEYIKTYFPDDFNDFVSNNGIMMLVELLSYLTAVLSMRSDVLANEGFLPTSNTSEAVTNHLALINQVIRRAAPAIVDIDCSVLSPVGSDVHISAGLQFSVTGDDGTTITYEAYRSPTDLTGDIVIPTGKRSIIAYGVEGRVDQSTTTSDGSANQKIIINTSIDVLEQPIRVNVTSGGLTEEWNQIDAIERATANSKAYEVRLFDRRVEFIFGDNQTGAIPTAGADIQCTYRLGGGVRGRIGAGVINEQRPITPEYPYVAPVSVTFRNVTPSSGGTNKETLEEAKKRAPLTYATHDSIVTDLDYANLVGSFSHPTFGSVAKAVATIRTGLNANRVELYVLAEGPDGPITPNEGLKRAVASYVDSNNVLTDHAVVLDGKLHSVDLDMNIVINRTSDASDIKVKVDTAISTFFAVDNWDLGEALYVSQLYDVINQIDGVKYADIFNPSDNILATGQVNSSLPGVDVNELIALGNREIKYYYETVR